MVDVATLYQTVRQIETEHNLEAAGVALYDTDTEVSWSYRGDRWFRASSSINLAVLLAVFRQIERGELSLQAQVHVRNRFTSVVNQEPFMLDVDDVNEQVGRTMSVSELGRLMIARSNNLAANLLIDLVGIPTIQLALDEMDINGARMIRGLEDESAIQSGLNNEVTANGLLQLLRSIVEKRAYSEAASNEMLKMLSEQRYRRGVVEGVPAAARVAHVPGAYADVFHDAAVVYLPDREPYMLVVLTQFAEGQENRVAVGEISREIFGMLTGMQHG